VVMAAVDSEGLGNSESGSLNCGLLFSPGCACPSHATSSVSCWDSGSCGGVSNGCRANSAGHGK
jgi:hypothetical protein